MQSRQAGIHYTIESYHGRIRDESLLFYLAYNFYFCLTCVVTDYGELGKALEVYKILFDIN